MCRRPTMRAQPNVYHLKLAPSVSHSSQTLGEKWEQLTHGGQYKTKSGHMYDEVCRLEHDRRERRIPWWNRMIRINEITCNDYL